MQNRPFKILQRGGISSIVVHPDERFATLNLPFREIQRNGKTFNILPHKPDTSRVMRNLGYDIPSPVLYRYDWAGVTPFISQRDTAAELTMSKRAYVLSEMGAGKTLAALFAFDFLRTQGAAHKLLIVAPLSTLNVVWHREIFSYLPHLSSVVVHGTRAQRVRALQEDVDVYIINHHGLKVFTSKKKLGRGAVTTLDEELASRTDIDCVVLDELATYRKKNTDLWRAAQAVIQGRRWVWGMTGGPVPREPTDAWAQIRLLTPDNVTTSFKRFRDETMLQVTQFKWIPKDDALDTVYAAMQPSVRFTRAQCVDLPPTTYSYREAALTPEQYKAYQQMQNEFVTQHPSGTITAVNAGIQVNKLLQICCGAVYDAQGATVELDHKSRIAVVREVVDESEGKVIILCPFKHAVRLVENGLKGYTTYATVTGDTPKSERDKIFTEFQFSPNPKVLIAHPRVMAHGLTLTAASTILWYAPYPDLEIYAQANARAPRPGQKLHTHVIHIVGTAVEQRITKVLQKRGNMQAALLSMFDRDLSADMLLDAAYQAGHD